MNMTKDGGVLTWSIGIVCGGAVVLVSVWMWRLLAGGTALAAVLGIALVGSSAYALGELRARRSARTARDERVGKYQRYYRVLAHWMILRTKGRSIAEYLHDQGVERVAIYGMGRIGLCLYHELRQAGVTVICGIDRDAGHFSYMDIKVVPPEDGLDGVDMVIVTVISRYESIAEQMKNRTGVKVASLEDVVESL